MAPWHRLAHAEALQQQDAAPPTTGYGRWRAKLWKENAAAPSGDDASASVVPELDDKHVRALQQLGYSTDQIEKLNLAQHRAILQHKIPAKGHVFTPRQSAPVGSPSIDTAQSILEAEPNLDQETKAQIWDHFHGSRNAAELARRIQDLPLPPETALKLLEAKSKTGRQPDAMDNIVSGIMRLPENIRQIAESSPRLLAEFVKAALKEHE